MNFFIFLGMIFISVSGLCIGSWMNGYQYSTEPKEDLEMMKKVAKWSTLAGVVSFAVAGLMYFLSEQTGQRGDKGITYSTTLENE